MMPRAENSGIVNLEGDPLLVAQGLGLVPVGVPDPLVRGLRAEQPFTDYLNNTPKFVVLTNLQEPLQRQNSTVKGSDFGVDANATLDQKQHDPAVKRHSHALLRLYLSGSCYLALT